MGSASVDSGSLRASLQSPAEARGSGPLAAPVADVCEDVPSIDGSGAGFRRLSKQSCPRPASAVSLARSKLSRSACTDNLADGNRDELACLQAPALESASTLDAKTSNVENDPMKAPKGSAPVGKRKKNIVRV